MCVLSGVTAQEMACPSGVIAQREAARPRAVLAAGPANVIADDVHPNDAGAALFVDVVAGAVDDC